MKIIGIRWGTVSIPLRTPFRTALREVRSVEDILVEIVTDTGETGFGEAPPTGVITGDTAESVCGALRHHLGPALLGQDLEAFEPLTARVQRALIHNTSAKAAVDMALWDLYGKLRGLPVYQLLGSARSTLETDLTISVNDPETMAKDAADAVSRGFDCLKIKVGIHPALDVERLAAVRAAVPSSVTLRVDANQAWEPRQAVRILNRMQDKGLNLELVEQPVPAKDLEGLKYVRDHSEVPVLADESVFSPEDALKILESRAADLINIKLMKCGGITPALRITSLAELFGVPCMIGCMLEGRVSVSAAVHLACARSVINRADLDGPMLCASDPVHGGPVFSGKSITVSDTPGLGITGVDGVRPLGDLALA